MKKILAAFLILSIALGFVACSSNDDYTPEPGKEGENGGDEEEEINDDDLVLVDWKPNPKFSWSDDWNDPNSPNYKPEGYNPLEGVWRYVNSEKVEIFYPNLSRSTGETYFFGGMIHSTATRGYFNYKVSSTGYRLQLTMGYISIYEYKVIDNVLYQTAIYNGPAENYNANTPPRLDYPVEILVKVKNPQAFKWRGDWNDSKDPSYKPQGYNPLIGAWIKINNAENSTGRDAMIIGNDNILTEATFYTDRYYTTFSSNSIATKYNLAINDIAFHENKIGSNEVGIDLRNIFSYRLKGNTLEVYPTSDYWSYVRKYEKVENPIYSPIAEKFHEFEGKWRDPKNHNVNIIFSKLYGATNPPPFLGYGVRGTLVNVTSTSIFDAKTIYVKEGSIVSYTEKDGKSIDIKYEKVGLSTMRFTTDGKVYNMERYY